MPKDYKAFASVIIFAFIVWCIEYSIRIMSEVNQYYPIIGQNPFFSMVYITNTGAAWGILKNATGFLIFFGIFAVSIALFYTYKWVTVKQRHYIASAGLFIAGVLGNLIQRIENGQVIDYIKLSFIDFPVFNLFDACIVVSLVIYFIGLTVEKWKKKI